ncbi:hypothetical protein TSUD_352830 [Trifolium subterraneum]|nr:hypothetical protein TSUD_352830 [Trifolium subterraneum]
MLHFQALVAVSEVIQQLKEKDPKFIRVKANEPTKIVLLSLGCGSPNIPKVIDAKKALNFSFDDWVPLLDVGLSNAAGDTTEYHLASEYDMDPSIGGVTDEATMKKLVEIGEGLLEETVKTIDPTSFIPHEQPIQGTNAQALDRLAEILYKERQQRLKMKAMKKMGRPFIEAITSPLRMFGIME